MKKHDNNAVFSIKGLTARLCLLIEYVMREVKGNIEWDDDCKHTGSHQRISSCRLTMTM